MTWCSELLLIASLIMHTYFLMFYHLKCSIAKYGLLNLRAIILHYTFSCVIAWEFLSSTLPLLYFIFWTSVSYLHFLVNDIGAVSTREGMNAGVYQEGSPSNSINFRELEIGKTETRVIYLRNESERETHFSILSDENGIFQLSSKQGIIPAYCTGYAVR